MKVAIACDALIERNHYISIVESFLLMFPEAELYSIVHKKGGIIGPVEQHKIHSTYLSNIANDWDTFWKKSFLIPGALKNLTVPCHFDLLICISNGLSQGVDVCEGVKKITYLYDFSPETHAPKSFMEKIFRPYLRRWAQKQLLNTDLLWVANKELYKRFEGLHPKMEVFRPFIKLSDYPLLPEAQRNSFPKDFFLLSTEGLQLEEAKSIMNHLDEIGIKYKWFGDDKHLETLKSGPEDKRFFGKRCSGEAAPMFAASKGFVQFKEGLFPEHAIASMACGTPVIVKKSDFHQSYLGDYGALYFNDEKDFYSQLGEFDKASHEWEAKKIRAKVMDFHDIKFKAKANRQIEKIFA